LSTLEVRLKFTLGLGNRVRETSIEREFW